MSFGPSSAFGGFPSATRPTTTSRRLPSSGSVKEDMKHAASLSNGPTPNDSNSIPTLGSWETGGLDRERDSNSNSNNLINNSPSNLINGNQSRNQSISNNVEQQRSFSSILSPTQPIAANSPTQDPLKPFVYSREFLLSLYDESKASKRPIELARHDIATRDSGGKPWALSDWRDGEKELFATSIHPTARNGTTRNNSSKNDNSSTTLDLSTLGSLPRERDRAQSSEPEIIRGSLTAGIGNSSIIGGEERKRGGTLGSGSIGSGSTGLSGGVLGGMMGSRAPIGTSGTRRDAPGTIAGGKEVWQGGRWRRGGTAEPEEEKRTPRRFGSTDPVTEDSVPSVGADLSIDDQEVPTSWDDEMETKESQASPIQVSQSPIPITSSTVVESYLSDPDLTHHAVNVLGSLSLDSDPTDDPLLRSSIAPPGLSTLSSLPAPVEIDWQYRDPSGQVQGPFNSAMMHDWYRQNFFSGDLAVKRVTELEYETLENLVRRSPDAETPFLTSPFQPTVILQPLTSAASWGTPIDQFSNNNSLSPGGGQRTFSGSLYDQFSGTQNTLFDPSRQPQQPIQTSNFDYSRQQQQYQPQQQQQQIRPSVLDPWGAPLSNVGSVGGYAPVPAWQDNNNGGGGMYDGRFNGLQQQQQPQQQYQQLSQQQLQQPRQQQQQNLYQQQQPIQSDPSLASTDVFGRQTIPTSPFFDPNQLTSNTTSDWSRLNSLPSPTPVSQQLPSLNQANWTTAGLLSPSLSSLTTPSTTLENITSPIGTVSSLYDPVPVPTLPIPSAWGIINPIAIESSVSTLSPSFASLSLPSSTIIESIALPEEITQVQVEPIQVPVSTPAKPVTISPWTKDDGDSAPSTPSGPSLRQIQEAESKASELRKTADRQIAARTQALAAVQAAQKAAAAEAESLPSTSTWASSSTATTSTASPISKVAAPAPWSKPIQAKAAGKTMKEIQEEEERRKKLAAVTTSATGPSSSVRGYAGSIGQLAPAKPGAPWTTVGIKPPTTTVVPASRPIIPGGSIITPRSVSGTATLPAKPTTIVTTPVRVTTALPPSRPVSRSNGTTVYDADSPPPPSSEFMKWTKEALKGLTVPMDEFIQMLLSFPLEASADVLEIISDSVYANSSTLDGRRFANDYASRRKLDVAARYPSIVLKPTKVPGRPASMADALKSQPIVKTPEWSVKVQKKKGGK